VSVGKKSVRKIAAAGGDQYMLRFPEGMRDKLAKLAEANGRSMNTEVVAAIEKHLQRGSDIEMLETKLDQLWSYVRQLGRHVDTPLRELPPSPFEE
jgi:predicted DNA-binding protein